MAETHLSQETYDRLTAELEDLTTVGRTRIAQAIEAARNLGDLSENGDYHAAKDQQGHMEGRIRQLEAILANCEIVEAVDDGVVSVGSIVTILFDGDDEDMAERYLVDTVEERRSGLDVVTPGSPTRVSGIESRPAGETSSTSAILSTIGIRVLESSAEIITALKACFKFDISSSVNKSDLLKTRSLGTPDSFRSSSIRSTDAM